MFFLTFSIFLCSAVTLTSAAQFNIGAIIDVNTRIGREEKIAMFLATRDLNKVLGNKINIKLYLNDSGGNPLQAAMAADYLLKESQVAAVLGMETWQEAVSVADVTKNTQVPVLTFATSLIALPQMSTRWPFLVRMANNDYQEMRCVASLVGSYQWRRVIAIYEHDGYISDSGILALLSDELKAVGSEVEYWLAFPPLSTLSDPTSYVEKELEKLDEKASRVFILIGCSLELAFHIVTQAKHTGLMGKHSAWITTSSVTNLFHSANSSVISSMQGIIGIKTHFSKTNPHFLNLSMEFTKNIQKIYPDEDIFGPGIYALRAYDTVFTIASALASITNNSRALVGEILSSNLSGLSGEIQFKNGESSHSSRYEIVNVFGPSYEELKFWSSEYNFSDDVNKNSRGNTSVPPQVLGGRVHWPGGLQSVPVGWAIPSDDKPMVIGLPGRAPFKEFVKVQYGEEPTGYCIDVFKKAVEILGYNLSYKFEVHNGSYDELVDLVYSKKIDAAVGDITILANRSKLVDFTQPYAESSLTMVVPVKAEQRAWLFVKPFTGMAWLSIFFLFLYTMLVVWLMEHRSNPAFKGPWTTQFSTAAWFTFSTFFFAHREDVRNNYTRAVMLVWFCAVFVIATSYQASLTSMLTVKRLQPTVTDIEELKINNQTVGCDGDTFVMKYVQDVLKFHPDNIKNITGQYEYAFKSGLISAAFLELPYERVFLSTNSKKYIDAGVKDRFGGFGFAFPLASPLAVEFSKAFLKLSEDGTLNKLDKNWFPPITPDSSSDSNIDDQRLSFGNFWGLFLVTGSTSTLIVVLYKLFGRRRDPDNTGQLSGGLAETHVSQSGNVSRLMSLDVQSLNELYTPQEQEQSHVQEIQMEKTYTEDPAKPLRQTMTFPVHNGLARPHRSTFSGSH